MLIKPKIVEVMKDDPLHEEFIVAKTSKGIWVTSDIHHIFASPLNSFYIEEDLPNQVVGINDSNPICSNFLSGDVRINGSKVEKDKSEHWYIWQESGLYLIPTGNMSGVIRYDAKRDDITYVDEFKYFAILDKDYRCWQILKTKAVENTGQNGGIASSKYGVTYMIEVNKSVATNDDGSLSSELLDCSLSALPNGYWKDPLGKTLYYWNTWKP